MTDLPEQRDRRKPTIDDPVLTVRERKLYDQRIGLPSDRDYWNARAAWAGCSQRRGGEHPRGARNAVLWGEHLRPRILARDHGGDAPRRPGPDEARRGAIRRGEGPSVWKGAYAETTYDEYWAEGTQSWFDSNKLAVVDGRVILSDASLKVYDPCSYELLGGVYGTRHRLTGDAFYKHPARKPVDALPPSARRWL